MNTLSSTLCLMAVAAITAADAQAMAPGRLISQDDFTRTAENTVNGVVSVKSYATPRMRQMQGYGDGDFFADPFEFFFGMPQQRQPRQQPQQQKPQQRQTGLGSGVIISEDGYIVTNNHVIADAERLEVTLNDNRNFNATVIGADPTSDLALIKIDAPDLHVIPMGNSDSLRVGEWVLAVGNPFGFTSTVTSGIVSAKARNISTTTRTPSSGNIESYIQTDAAVNHGNSGGALVNLKGELVGINTAIYSQNGSYVGCSFAIPTSIVNKVIDDLKTYGTVQRAYLGVSFVELTPELVSEKKITGTTTGIYVAEVADRSAAKEAGLKEGDVITAVNGIPTPNTASMQEAIAKFSPGDRVELRFVRDGKTETRTVTLRNRRGDTEVTRPASLTDLGCAFTKVPAERLEQLEISHGVAVTGLEDGRVKDSGIRDGFIILVINGQRVSTPEDVEKLYNAIMKSDDDKVMYIKGIYPTGKRGFYAVPLAD
ncbi:MAG: Do family serine endopeptidase [Muribaculaceae bacterium]|nr:Do family serine endopeptidase [Muribaculaceae bacterium]